MFKLNPLMLNDFYKECHADLYNTDSAKIYATWTPRKSRVRGVDKVVVFGIQSFIKEWLIEYFNDNFFNQDVNQVVKEYLRLTRASLNSDGLGEDRIRALHKLGYLPLKICALEEGTLCPIRVPMLTIENTLPEFYWLTNFIESFMSSEIWGGMTSATLARKYRGILDKWADITCDDRSHVDFQAHDFSFRGMNTTKASYASSAGHLLSFLGTDTVPALPWLEYYYNCNMDYGIIGTSIPATEHSIAEFNSYGNEYDEYESLKRIITEVYPSGAVSYVGDTRNLWNVITDVLPRLKKEILSRDGKLVIRPDSGDPCDIICGINTKTYFDPYKSKDMPEKLMTAEDSPYYESINKGVIELLWDIFGGTINSKGYKVLDWHIGCIYGDAITTERAEEICCRLESKGFASSNIVLGVGSFTYQYNTRDTFGFALKTTYAKQGDTEMFLFKDPITDSGEKKSNKGMVAVIQDGDTIKCIDHLYEKDKLALTDSDLLKPVFENGVLLRETTLEDIRTKLKQKSLEKVLI